MDHGKSYVLRSSVIKCGDYRIEIWSSLSGSIIPGDVGKLNPILDDKHGGEIISKFANAIDVIYPLGLCLKEVLSALE